LLLARLRAVLLISTFWAAAWVVVGLALVIRLATLERDMSSARLVWLASIVVPRSSSIGFDCGVAFSVALVALGARGLRHASVRLAGPFAAAIVGALASGRLRLEPVALTAFVCGICAVACAVISLAIASRDPRREHSASSLTNVAAHKRSY
jgi:hypothetical protein